MLQVLYDAGGDFDEGAMVAAIDSVNLDAIAFLAELAQRGDGRLGSSRWRTLTRSRASDSAKNS